MLERHCSNWNTLERISKKIYSSYLVPGVIDRNVICSLIKTKISNNATIYTNQKISKWPISCCFG